MSVLHALEPRQYVPVPVENLLPGKALPFSLYHEVEGEHILFRGAGRALEKAERDRILQTRFTRLSICSDEMDRYRAYLDGVLKEILVAPGIPIEEKAASFYSLSLGIGGDVLRAPDRSENIAGASEIVRETHAFLGQSRDVLHRFMRLMSSRYDLVASSVNVTAYGLALARAAGIRDIRAILDLGLGLFLHDVGLRLLPDKILTKKGVLTAQDRFAIRRHTLFGVDLFMARNLLPERALVVIRDHHERCDGSGYPNGMTAEKLSTEARIAGIVTAFDFLTTGRPSRRALPSFEAIRSMARENPRAFDPELLRRFIQIVGKEKIHA
jgi:HD-GYP domain-containing protein (c-di-GMP phosphodiesterase class II)